MTRDVTVLNRTQKVQLIHLTMQGLQSKIYYLYENYNSYHENYSEQALQLYNVYNKYESAVQTLLVTEEMNKLDDDGLTQMATLSLEVSELYKLGVRTPDDQKEYEATIAQFKKDVYDEALKRLSDNKKETDNLETDLLAEAKSKGGKNLTPVYEYYNLQKQIDKNQYNIDYAEMMGNSDDYSKYYDVNKDLRYKAKIIKENTPLLSHLPYEETIVKDIKKLCSKIRKAQNNVEIQLTKGKYPIWELNPVIAYIFETNEFYTPEKQEYIFDWIQEQERIDQLVDVFKNAIPITLSIMCFFMPGGASVAMLILQGANALAGAAAAYDDISDAKAQNDMAYSQYPISADAQKIIDNADLSAIERNYAMAILSGAFSMLDFAECVKIARKLGIGDEVMKYFAQGRKFRLSVDETEELVRKAGKTVSAVEKIRKDFPQSFIHKLSLADNSDELFEILYKKQEYVKYLNEKTLNTIANSSDIKSALEIMIKQNEEIVRIGNEKALEVIATQSIREQGPCLSTIYDQDLKQYFFGHNFKKNETVRKQYENWIHNDANAIIKARFLSYDDSINKGLIVLSEGADKRLAGHSEIRALNDLLEARKAAGLPINDKIIENVYIYNVDLTATRKNNCIITKPRCENCTVLTDGANTILNK